jgi:hypothetical protein
MKLFILQTTILDYRGKFFTELKKRLGDDFEYACGKDYSEESVNILLIFAIKYYFFNRRRVLYCKKVVELIG